MSELINIFKNLEPNQIKIQNISLDKPSFLKKYNRLDLKIDSKYKNSLWFIFYYFIKKNNKTNIDINNDFDTFMNEKLEEFQKNKIKKFNKTEITNSILRKTNDGFTSKMYIADLFDITLFIYYSNNDLILKFGNGSNNYLTYLKGDEANIYYNSDDYTFSPEDDNYINVDDILNCKKLKINELRSLADKLKIDTKDNGKFKLKNNLLSEIDNFIKIKILI